MEFFFLLPMFFFLLFHIFLQNDPVVTYWKETHQKFATNITEFYSRFWELFKWTFFTRKNIEPAVVLLRVCEKTATVTQSQFHSLNFTLTPAPGHKCPVSSLFLHCRFCLFSFPKHCPGFGLWESEVRSENQQRFSIFQIKLMNFMILANFWNENYSRDWE